MPHVQWGDEWFVGSGGRAFEAYSKRYTRPPVDPSVAERDALEFLVGLLTQMNCEDMLLGTARSAGVGGGYEALYWSSDAQQFSYVADVTYFAVGARMTDAGHLGQPPQMFDTFKKLWIVDECSFLAVSNADGSGKTGVWALTPAGHGPSRAETIELLAEIAERGPIDAKSAYYVGLIVFAAPTVVAPPAPLVACPWDGQTLIGGSPEGIEAKLPPEYYEAMFRQKAAAYRANPYPVASVQFTSSPNRSPLAGSDRHESQLPST